LKDEREAIQMKLADGGRYTISKLSVVLVLAVTVGTLVVPTAAYGGAKQYASSSAGGITYGPASIYPRSVMKFRFDSNSGTITVENGTNTRPLGSHYVITVKCAKFLGHGLVYWGGPVTKNYPSNFDATGKWDFGYLRAGGPGHGVLAGEIAPAGTCFSAANRPLAGPAFPIIHGVITVS
jgi:hypothetical protein